MPHYGSPNANFKYALIIFWISGMENEFSEINFDFELITNQRQNTRFLLVFNSFMTEVSVI